MQIFKERRDVSPRRARPIELVAQKLALKGSDTGLDEYLNMDSSWATASRSRRKKLWQASQEIGQLRAGRNRRIDDPGKRSRTRD